MAGRHYPPASRCHRQCRQQRHAGVFFVPLHRCIDNAIHSAAGVQLRLACDRLMREQKGIRSRWDGRKSLTGTTCPHAMSFIRSGPIVAGGIPSEGQECQLADCYRSCLALADAHGLESIAFYCISTGEFGFPQKAGRRDCGRNRAGVSRHGCSAPYK